MRGEVRCELCVGEFHPGRHEPYVGEFHPGRRKLHTGEFRPSHGELGKRSERCARTDSAWATVSCTWAASWAASAPPEMSVDGSSVHGVSAGSLLPGRPPRAAWVEGFLESTAMSG